MKCTPTTKDAFDLLLKGSLALAKMEHNGVRIDETYLKTAITDVTVEIQSLEKEMEQSDFYKTWKRAYGDRLKIGSYTQISDVLFNKMGYESTVKTPTGRAAAGKKVLDKIDHPFVKTFIKVQNLKKSLSTYLEGIRDEAVDGFVHPDYGLNHNVSFRSNCRNPNWQNNPVRDPVMGNMIRRCYIPRKGRRLVEIDLSGAEVRAAACYNLDPTLIRYIEDPTTDMHRDLAMQLYFLTQEQVEKKTSRDWAKNRKVFPTFYGSVYFQTAPALWEPVEAGAKLPDGTTFKAHLKAHGIRKLGDCSPKAETKKGTFVHHVREIEKDFWENRFRVYNQWKKDWYEAYLRSGEFTMLSGFTCRGVMKRNDVINYGVQGFAFHWMLWVIVQTQKWLDKYGMKTKTVGEVHDSLVLDVPEDELQDVISKVVHLITNGLRKHWPSIIVPVEAEVDVTPVDGSWVTKAQWVEKNGRWESKEEAA